MSVLLEPDPGTLRGRSGLTFLWLSTLSSGQCGGVFESTPGPPPSRPRGAAGDFTESLFLPWEEFDFDFDVELVFLCGDDLTPGGNHCTSVDLSVLSAGSDGDDGDDDDVTSGLIK